MKFDELVYQILIVLYASLRFDKPLPSELESLEQLEAVAGVKIPPKYWDMAIRTIAHRMYAVGFECDYEKNRIYIGDVNKLTLTFDGYEYMKSGKFPDPDEFLDEFAEHQPLIKM